MPKNRQHAPVGIDLDQADCVLGAYPSLIHRLTYQRNNHRNIHVRGYREGTTATPFDMTVLNELDRFHLAARAIDRLPDVWHGTYAKQEIRDRLAEHKAYIYGHGEDMPQIRDWRWSPPD